MVLRDSKDFRVNPVIMHLNETPAAPPEKPKIKMIREGDVNFFSWKWPWGKWSTSILVTGIYMLLSIYWNGKKYVEDKSEKLESELEIQKKSWQPVILKSGSDNNFFISENGPIEEDCFPARHWHRKICFWSDGHLESKLLDKKEWR